MQLQVISFPWRPPPSTNRRGLRRVRVLIIPYLSAKGRPRLINPAGLEPGGVFFCRVRTRQNLPRHGAPSPNDADVAKILDHVAKILAACLGRARLRRPGSTTVHRCPWVDSVGVDAGRGFPRAPHGGQGAQRRAADEPAKGFGSGEARRRRPCFANAKYYGTNTFHRKALDTPSKWEGRVS